MKKHIFGVALFSLIVASFALIYAFFYAPSIPPQEAVKPPLSRTETQTEKPSYCNLERAKLSYEVQSSQFDLVNNRLTSKVKVMWNGSGTPPARLFARTNLFTLDRKEFSETIKTISFTKVFENRNEATLIIVSKLDAPSGKIDERQNLYVSFDFSETEEMNNSSKAGRIQPVRYQVLFIHGKKEPVRETVVNEG
jgi:hypothetical protein